ncbi:MAG: DUF438 domain-containing protein [Bacteroidetes bacterium]|jgi:uncharacterized protein|nr:DUF438 domain-containing protein [Bacteroidota bacterium]MBT3751332.1 DUF438 domain-containing protein [Bacteroidota bacterium]MBT4401172.1 DUF438 domain-containing protein [Bacteroidota bacterium]MBT4411193.1 DUF438 domain-containing protein [Bacteroidota bacterium]MBT5425232.1 DUF438 domain-containing protein [Bacteroidota bacterium]
MNKRQLALLDLFAGLSRNKSGRELYASHKWAIRKAQAIDVIDVVHALAQEDIPMDNMKTGISKALNLLYNQLSDYPIPEPMQGGFLNAMMENNKVLDEKLSGLRPIIKTLNQAIMENDQSPQTLSGLDALSKVFIELNNYPLVYQLKENILFPVLEKHWENYRCVQVMWSIHDDIRQNLKRLNDLLQVSIERGGLLPDSDLHRLLGDLFFDLYAVKFREERILIPVILNTIGEDDLNSAYIATTDLDFPFISGRNQDVVVKKKQSESKSDIVDLPTGSLSPETLNLIFNHLPVDMSYVDENDEVRFYSDPPHRIFPRTKALIGRKVQNCHPPESVHIVNEIIESFKKGEKDIAEFWIDIRGKKIQINYYAVRDEDKTYRGVLEVSQDITEMINRTGEQRLLDW